MKRSFLLATTLALSFPTHAQMTIPAPRGWTTRTKAQDATTFTPPALATGEKYSVTIYEAAPLSGKTPEEFLRQFAGPVGTKPGNLGAPLQIKTGEGTAVGVGAYVEPNKTYLLAVFSGISVDGANIHLMRTLMSQPGFVKRYQAQNGALAEQLLERAQSAKEARDEAAQAERERFKWTTAPGRGVQSAQIAAIIRHFDVDFEPGLTGLTSHTTDDAFLLLRDGTIYAGLPVPPDEFDAARARQHEPAKWGKWRQVGGRYQVSWAGAPFKALPGFKTLPAPAGLRLNGYYRGASSESSALSSSLSIWGVTFGADGRFRKSTGGSSIIGVVNSSAGAITTTRGQLPP